MEIDLKKAKVLITGGSDGIGKGLAKRFLEGGSQVLITGRNREKLVKAIEELPGVLTLENDISDPAQRILLASHVKEHFQGLNILINNAGIQRRVSLADDHASWDERQAEINTILAAPVHLNDLLIPFILSSGEPGAIINVSSGGAFIPQVFAPVYSACKAAIHSYTMVLRHALSETNCKVIELIPPAVQTALAGKGNEHGASLDEFTDKVFRDLVQGNKLAIGFGQTEDLVVQLSGKSQESMFASSAEKSAVNVYHL